MIHNEDDLLPISYLAQYFYCVRRAGLLLLDRIWDDNIHTVEGSIVHKRVNEKAVEVRGDVVRVTSLALHSLRLGLFGFADSVEFYSRPGGCEIPGMEGTWETVPVEHKHGRLRNEIEYEIQLCGQALCLEEMLGVHCVRGFIYYAGDRRRKEVVFDSRLRTLVEEGSYQLHELLLSGALPSANHSKKCKECSLQSRCQPALSSVSAVTYLKDLGQLVKEEGDNETFA